MKKVFSLGLGIITLALVLAISFSVWAQEATPPETAPEASPPAMEQPITETPTAVPEPVIENLVIDTQTPIAEPPATEPTVVSATATVVIQATPPTEPEPQTQPSCGELATDPETTELLKTMPPLPTVKGPILETIQAENIDEPQCITIKRTESQKTCMGLTESQFPWLIVLLIVIVVAIASILVGMKLIKAGQENNIRQQANAKEIALSGFTAAVKAKETEEWINDLRNGVNDLLSMGLALHLEVMNANYDPAKFQVALEKLLLSQNRISLLLNKKEESQSRLEKAIAALIGTVGQKKEEFKVEDYKKSRQEIIDQARELFQKHRQMV